MTKPVTKATKKKDTVTSLRKDVAKLRARLKASNTDIEMYLDGRWIGSDEGWFLTIELNEKALEATK